MMELSDMDKLSSLAKEFVLLEGACAAGIATVDTLAGGPPSSELTYVLPEAKSAICFAVAIDRKTIAPYLLKKERLPLERAFIQANALASGIALHLANFLTQKGFPSVSVAANNVFRPSDPGQLSCYFPDIAHRYIAVRSGVGHLGLSGNLITQKQGAAVILATTVTSARLQPTPPLSPEESYCDSCRLCMASCVAGFMDHREETSLSLGGHEVVYAKRRHYGRCDPVCSGYTGLHSSGKWSTWSPGRFEIPQNDNQLASAYARMQSAYSKWPKTAGGRYFFFLDEKLRVSCANCQLVCCPEKEERMARYNMLTTSGVIVQKKDGCLVAVPPEEAKRVLLAMPPSLRDLYEE